MQHILFLVALVGPALFVVWATVLGAMTPKYSALHNTISEQALGKYKAAHAVNYVLNGSLILLLGILCAMNGSSLLPSLAVMAIGAVIVLSAYFKTDPITKAKLTKEGLIHNLLFLVGMLSLIAGMSTQVSGSTFGSFTLACLIVAVVGLGYTVFGRSYRGLMQRALVFTIMGWITVFALTTSQF